MKKSNESFIKGALVLSLGGLFAKILGALYRIPLTNIIGSYGMGLYQLVFPPYILFLTLAQCGVPVALSKLIAEKNQLCQANQGKKMFQLCLCILGVMGAICAVVMAGLSKSMANWQGNGDTAMAFVIIAPALVFVPITNVLKAHFQGNMNMVPSGITTVIEQIVKLVVGLTCAISFMPDVQKAVMGAVFAVTVSEFGSLVIMLVAYLAKGRQKPLVRLQKTDYKPLASQIFVLAVPVALGAIAMQLSQVIDSVMVVNLLSVRNATELYGLWTGPVNSMLGLPIALSSGVAVTALPTVTKTFVCGDNCKLNQSFNSSIKLTLVIALPCALGMTVLSKPILSLLYGALPAEEIYTASVLLSLSGASIVFLALLQTAVSVCQAVGKPYATVVIVSLSIVVKALLNLLLLPMSNINIYGAAISETMCYLFATVCVIIYLRVKVGLKLNFAQSLLKPLSAGMLMTLCITVGVAFGEQLFSSKVGTLAMIALAGGVYFATVFWLKVFDKNEFKILPTKQT